MKCCICNIQDPLLTYLQPLQCKDKTHKICKECWFAPGGFAEETRSHKCPGCLAKK